METQLTQSKTHQYFADLLNNPRALNHPEEFLGPNWQEVLNFWIFIDTLSSERLKIANVNCSALDYSTMMIAIGNVLEASTKDVAQHPGVAAQAAYGVLYNYVDVPHYAGFATAELIASHNLQEQGKPLTFLSLFDYQSPFNN